MNRREFGGATLSAILSGSALIEKFAQTEDPKSRPTRNLGGGLLSIFCCNNLRTELKTTYVLLRYSQVSFDMDCVSIVDGKVVAKFGSIDFSFVSDTETHAFGDTLDSLCEASDNPNCRMSLLIQPDDISCEFPVLRDLFHWFTLFDSHDVYRVSSGRNICAKHIVVTKKENGALLSLAFRDGTATAIANYSKGQLSELDA